MRFVEDGPDIPDQLLNERDEGKVVFFCGAGVSMARAEMPDFYGLVDRVLKKLRVDDNHKVARILARAKQLSESEKFGNENKSFELAEIMSADRMFGLLERDFYRIDIYSAVAHSLKPTHLNVDQSAHEILLRLATTRESKLQLITTNFDRLFEIPGNETRCFLPRHLPRLSFEELNGLVYLHGRVNADYTKADNDSLVVSSADFGEAYLADGWATDFFRELIRKHTIVFLGYSADDPPIKYLLEGMNRNSASLSNVYAFIPQSAHESREAWQDKGIHQIPFSEKGDFRLLWDSLEGWAVRADDPDKWRTKIVLQSKNGPENLSSTVRGQVAHVVSSISGAKLFSEIRPSAKWLYTFDSRLRYGTPKTEFLFEQDLDDPFLHFGLDSDIPPEKAKPDDIFSSRPVPRDAWDALKVSDDDHKSLSTQNVPNLVGDSANHPSKLPERLEHLADWISLGINEPAAIWWAATQRSIHPYLAERISRRLANKELQASALWLKAWQFVLYALRDSEVLSQSNKSLQLRRRIDNFGWNVDTATEFIHHLNPTLKIEPANMNLTVPPKSLEVSRITDLISARVSCPIPPPGFEVSEKWLEKVVEGIRGNIELAEHLIEEVGSYQSRHIGSLLNNQERAITPGSVTSFSDFVFVFSAYYKQLSDVNPAAARKEYMSWPVNSDSAFFRLKIWATGTIEFFSISDFATEILRSSQDAFWSEDHQRDLMLILRDRWSELSLESRRSIEGRIIDGPDSIEFWNNEENENYRNRSVLDRLYWLSQKKCELSTDAAFQIEKLRKKVRGWKPEFSDGITRASVSDVRRVNPNYNFQDLLNVPTESIIRKSIELIKESQSKGRFDDNPFEGLCRENPLLSLEAILAYSDKEESDYLWAWETLLRTEQYRTFEFDVVGRTVAELINLTQSAFYSLFNVASYWGLKVAENLSKRDPALFELFVDRLVEYLEQTSYKGPPSDNNDNRHFVVDSIKTSAGRVAWVVILDSRFQKDIDVEELSFTFDRLARLFRLNGFERCYAIAKTCEHIEYIYQIAPDWIEKELLSLLEDKESDEAKAFWDGWFSSQRNLKFELIVRLKNDLINLCKSESVKNIQHQQVSELVLDYWLKSKPPLNETTVFSDDDLRRLLRTKDKTGRDQLLFQLYRVVAFGEAQDVSNAIPLIKNLFQEIWPLEKFAKASSTTNKICNIIFCKLSVFEAIGQAVLQHISKINDECSFEFPTTNELDKIINKMPLEFVEILDKVLPDNCVAWPFDISDVFDQLQNNDEIITDERFNRLTRKLQAGRSGL